MSTKKALIIGCKPIHIKRWSTQELFKHCFLCNKITVRGKEDEVKEEEQIIKCTDHSMAIKCANTLLEYKN